MYLGLPMWLCDDEDCSCVWGFWSVIAAYLPIAGEDEYGEPAFAFVHLGERPYWPALWWWLKGGAS